MFAYDVVSCEEIRLFAVMNASYMNNEQPKVVGAGTSVNKEY